MQKYEVFVWNGHKYVRWEKTATLIYSTLWAHHKPQLKTWAAMGTQFKFKRVHDESRYE